MRAPSLPLRKSRHTPHWLVQQYQAARRKEVFPPRLRKNTTTHHQIPTTANKSLPTPNTKARALSPPLLPIKGGSPTLALFLDSSTSLRKRTRNPLQQAFKARAALHHTGYARAVSDLHAGAPRPGCRLQVQRLLGSVPSQRSDAPPPDLPTCWGECTTIPLAESLVPQAPLQNCRLGHTNRLQLQLSFFPCQAPTSGRNRIRTLFPRQPPEQELKNNIRRTFRSTALRKRHVSLPTNPCAPNDRFLRRSDA